MRAQLISYPKIDNDLRRTSQFRCHRFFCGSFFLSEEASAQGSIPNLIPKIIIMNRNSVSYSGFFNRRAGAALALCSLGTLLIVFNFATATPSPGGGTLSVSNPTLTWSDPVGPAVNVTGLGVGFSAPVCAASGVDCSIYTLTLDPSIFTASPGYDPTTAIIVIQTQWLPSQFQYSSFVEDKDGNVIASNTTGLDPATITIAVSTPNLQANGPYTIVTTLEIGSPGQGYNGTVSLQQMPTNVDTCNGCTPPRYQAYEAPAGVATQSGEPSIGVDWNPNVASLKQVTPGNASVGPTILNTGGISMFTATFDQYRVSFDDCSSPAINTWTDIAFIAQQTATLDAIGFTDHFTPLALGTSYPPPVTPGRTFHGQLTAGDSNTSYSDDDGATHIQSQGGGVPQGPDHETFGAGPYNPNASPPPPPPTVYPNAVYYCTQNIAPEAECSRSDDGGLTFGPGVPIYQNPQQCTGSIHGHIKVARDGTVYVPNYSCSAPGTGSQGVAVSTDNGITWTENNVPGSGGPKPGLVDPSVAIGLNDVGKPGGQTTNTIYFGYIDSDGAAKIAVSHDRGASWSTPQTVSAPFNLANTTFPAVVAGDDNRAAFGFLGTTTPGDSSLDPNFPGVWHLYIATTYDGGNSWVTIDATPDDPIQVGPVCNAGTTCSTKRNLLDFNGFDVDAEGRGIFGASDGCVNCTNSSSSADSNAAQGIVFRQSGGPRLFAQFDPVEPAAPASPQAVSATRQDATSVLVSWLEPDNAGSPITSYNIYRGTTSGGEAFLASVPNSETNKQTKYLDTTVDPTVTDYYYHVTAVNVKGESGFCQELTVTSPPLQQNACAFPYIQVDGAGSPGNVPSDPTGGELTIQNVDIGEPFTGCTDNSLTYVMQVQTLDPNNTGTVVLPPNAGWQIIFNVTDTAGNPETVFIELDTFRTDVPSATRIGRRDPTPTGTQDTTVCSNTPTSSCPKISVTETTDGTITFKLDVSQPLFFPAPAAPATGVDFTWDATKAGTKLSSIGGNTYLLAGVFLETVQTTGATGSYTRLGNYFCGEQPPVAALTAAPLSGYAPLTVTFDGSGSTDPFACATINSYTLSFGDGTPSVTQSTPTFTHTYTNPGDYPAQLIVSDTAGQTSTNLAEVVISASPTPTPTPTPAPTATPTPTPTPTPAPIKVGITSGPITIREGQSANYTVTASQTVSQPLTVNYAMSGTATNGTDYTLSGAAGQATIQPGQASTTVTLSATVDHVTEGKETATMTIQRGAGYRVGPNNKGTISIKDAP
jgi:PKD repeat protein